MLSGSKSIKAAHKMLAKWTPYPVKPIILRSSSAEYLKQVSIVIHGDVTQEIT
jgi:hypothetical protein